MTDAINKAVKKVRHKFIPHRKRDPFDDMIVDMAAKVYKNDLWERDKEVVRDTNFGKALRGLAKYREMQRQEAERLDEIRQERINNLRKARRTLKRIRSSE